MAGGQGGLLPRGHLNQLTIGVAYCEPVTGIAGVDSLSLYLSALGSDKTSINGDPGMQQCVSHLNYSPNFIWRCCCCTHPLCLSPFSPSHSFPHYTGQCAYAFQEYWPCALLEPIVAMTQSKQRLQVCRALPCSRSQMANVRGRQTLERGTTINFVLQQA